MVYNAVNNIMNDIKLGSIYQITHIESGAEFGPSPIASQTIQPLHQAAKENDIKKMLELLQEGQNVGALSHSKALYRLSPLAIAIQEGHVEMVKLLLDNNANPDGLVGQKNETSLHYATRSGKSEIVDLLLTYFANVAVKNYDKACRYFQYTLDFTHRYYADGIADQKFAMIYQNLGCAYQACAQYDAAIYVFQKAKKLYESLLKTSKNKEFSQKASDQQKYIDKIKNKHADKLTGSGGFEALVDQAYLGLCKNNGEYDKVVDQLKTKQTGLCLLKE